MASLTQWTWDWANSRRWWRTGKPGMLKSMGSQREGRNWVAEQQLPSIVSILLWSPLSQFFILEILFLVPLFLCGSSLYFFFAEIFNFLFLSRELVILRWSIFIMATLKFLSKHINMWFISVLVSVDYILSFNLWVSYSLVWWVIFGCIWDILEIILWQPGSC